MWLAPGIGAVGSMRLAMDDGTTEARLGSMGLAMAGGLRMVMTVAVAMARERMRLEGDIFPV